MIKDNVNKIDTSLLFRINKITNLDFRPVLNDINNFVDNEFNIIVDYFVGVKTLDNPSIFEKYDKIRKRFLFLREKIYHFRSRLFNVEYILFLEQLEQINDKLQYISNIDKWLRSSKSQNAIIFSSIRGDYIMGDGDTAEKISRNILKRENFLNNWMDIALSNGLLEDNYTTDGGTKISLPLTSSTFSYSINSVVDVIDGKSSYGKDFSRKIAFHENDLLILNNDDTIHQAVEILVLLRKGSNLDMPSLGIQEEMFVGSNRVYFNTPMLIRQLVESFTTDDTLIDFQVKEIKIEQDNFLLDFQVRTILGEIINLKNTL